MCVCVCVCVCGVVMCPCFAFLLFLAKEKRAGCFKLIVFLLLNGFVALSLFLMVIVAFPGHTHLLFEVHCTRFLFSFLISNTV